jgi:hypothetical protein
MDELAACRAYAPSRFLFDCAARMALLFQLTEKTILSL